MKCERRKRKYKCDNGQLSGGMRPRCTWTSDLAVLDPRKALFDRTFQRYVSTITSIISSVSIFFYFFIVSYCLMFFFSFIFYEKARIFHFNKIYMYVLRFKKQHWPDLKLQRYIKYLFFFFYLSLFFLVSSKTLLIIFQQQYCNYITNQ